MAKSKAQRMREYRERKKQQYGEAWLKQERVRTKSYFVRMTNLDTESKDKRREQNRISQDMFRKKKKQQKVGAAVEQQETSTVVQDETTDSLLTVKLPFGSSEAKSSGGKKRASRALARSYRKIETLEDQNEELKRKLRSAQKRLNRCELKKECNTPRSKTDKLLKDYGLKPKEVPSIRQRLIFGECVNEEIKLAKDAQKSDSRNVRIIHRIISGKIIKKYRQKLMMENVTNFNRRKSPMNKSLKTEAKKRLIEKRQDINNEVLKFLERDDNSRMLPGKADAVKHGKDKLQKRVLNDYMYNIHLKFLSESTISISRAAFYRCRPRHISLVNFTSRSVCLCVKHQNFSFLLRSLKSERVSNCTNPDKFVDMYKGQQESLCAMLETLPTVEEVKFQQWKRVKLKNGKERQRVVEISKGRKEFIEFMIESYNEFERHVQRVKDQYSAIRRMKEKLPKDQVLIQMDFSENYTCSTMEEIQSAYWNSPMVTLHPVVLYFISETGLLEHRSYVFVSEILNHNAAMVISIINKMTGVVKNIVPNVNCLHFWTDSPSSQYRNKTIFDFVSRFSEQHGLLSTWHYFECGHGKGPCDGVGGTTKRNADNAIKQGKALIQDAEDFFAWASKHESFIKYELVTETDYEISKKICDERNAVIKPLKGTLQLHAVLGTENGKLLVRNTSCACSECFKDGKFNPMSSCGWHERESLEKKPDNDKTYDKGRETSAHINTVVGVFVIACYDKERYVGKIIEVDNSDNTLHVTFMENFKKIASQFRWPKPEDKLWIDKDAVVKVIPDPMSTGKSGRMFTFDEDVLKCLKD